MSVSLAREALVETVRTFVALNVDVTGLRRVVEAVSKVSAPRELRWLAPTKLHVTLKFFGEIDAALAPAIRDALAILSAGWPAPRLGFSGVSGFPSAEAARVVFAATEDLSGDTTKLAAAVDALGEELGLPGDARPYLPHLTLARSRMPVDIATWAASIPKWRVVALASELVLYQSARARPGHEYDALGRFRLAARRSTR